MIIFQLLFHFVENLVGFIRAAESAGSAFGQRQQVFSTVEGLCLYLEEADGISFLPRECRRELCWRRRAMSLRTTDRPVRLSSSIVRLVVGNALGRTRAARHRRIWPWRGLRPCTRPRPARRGRGIRSLVVGIAVFAEESFASQVQG